VLTKEEKENVEACGYPHKDLPCYMGWREKPLGTGEATVIIVSLDEGELTNEQLGELMKVLQVTTFSEETIDFKIQELDW